MNDPISIVIPAFNQLEYCRQCISSIQANTRRPHRLILVDNGSTDGVSEFFDSVPGAQVIHAETNLGFPGGVNLGLKQAEGHVVLLNTDTVTPEGWLDRLEEALLAGPRIGLVGPMTNYASGSQQIDGLTCATMAEINAFARDLAQRNKGRIRDVARLVAFCVLIRDTVRQQVGLFDTGYGIGNFEDDDYCLRVLRAGYRLCVAEDAFVFHYGNRTFQGMGLTGETWRELMAENERRFMEKWNLKPEERCDHAQLSRQSNQEAKQAFEQGDFRQALVLLKRAIEVYPLSEINYNDLGVVLWQMGERERGFESFVQALRLRPSYAEARDNLREAAQALGKTDEAQQLLEGSHRG